MNCEDSLDDFDFLPWDPPSPPVPRVWSSPSTQHFETEHSLDDFDQPLILPPLSHCNAETVPLDIEARKVSSTLSMSDLEMVRAFLNGGASDLRSLQEHPRFKHPGVYALYYHGDFAFYRDICSGDSTCALYIGKSSKDVCKRLHDHIKTLSGVSKRAQVTGIENLKPEDFKFRVIITPKNQVGYTEESLIEFFKPVWNHYLKGFGEREGTARSQRVSVKYEPRWDTIHPGRDTGGKPREDNVETLLREAVIECRNHYKREMARLKETP